MQPSFAAAEDLLWVVGQGDETQLLRHTIETCLIHPHSKPVVIMRALETKVDAKLLRDLERDLHLLDETLDMALELTGARHQLKQTYTQQSSNVLLAHLSEKPLSDLTEDEKAMLRTVSYTHLDVYKRQVCYWRLRRQKQSSYLSPFHVMPPYIL